MNDRALEEEKEYLFWLSKIPKFGSVTIRKLWEHFQSFSVIYNIEETPLKALGILNVPQLQHMNEWKGKLPECKAQYASLKKRGVNYVTPLDEHYPKRLRNLYDYPMGLYIKGTLPSEFSPTVSIVGARDCSSYGQQVAEEFARILSEYDIQIISGLAMGIDGAAHRGAISVKKPTFGVLGCGVNICYPSRNYELYEAMIHCGGIISEFPMGTEPAPGNFPMRNRIISGLSDLILIVEAKERSGSLITAELGLEQGKEIMAIPGRITDRLSQGCNQLIQQGAGIALSPEDILDFFGCKREKIFHIQEKNINGLAKKEKMVYSCLDLKPKHLDEVAAECDIDILECMGILFELETKAYVKRTGNHYYGKNIQN